MSAAHYAIDLAAERPAASRWGLLLLALGCAAAAASAWAWQNAHEAQAELRQTAERLEGALASRGAATRAAQARVPTAAERRLQADLARIGADLHKPWFALLDALESRQVPKVQLQQLSVDTGFTRLQLQVEAPDLPELLQYVHALDTAGAPLQGAQLLGHEWQAAAGGPRRLAARISVALSAAPVTMAARAQP